MKKNDEIILEITGTTSSGDGVGHYDNIAVFVPLTTEGDTVKVKILKVCKNFCYGKLLEVIKPDKDRIATDCNVFAQCGGCVYRHISYDKECRIKQHKVSDCVKRIGKIQLSVQPIIKAENIDGYRNKAQYPISQSGCTGFFSVHSHRVVECGDCRLQPDAFSKICTAFTKWINDKNISVYDEKTGRGIIRHLFLRSADATGQIMVVVVINAKVLPHTDSLIKSLLSVANGRICSIQININQKNTNVILGDTCRVLWGEDYITDILCGNEIRISPLSFYQVNREMTEKLYKKASQYAEPEGKNILDLYCGVGTIGLSMANAAQSVIGVEIIAQAVTDAKENAQRNGYKNTRFICADAAEAAQQLSRENFKPDVVILDPPRKGCDRELLEIVAKRFSPEKIVYISCDPATFARDCARLFELGYKLSEYTPVDMFPRTSHVETVGRLEKIIYNGEKNDI